jgi:hypothetical protein
MSTAFCGNGFFPFLFEKKEDRDLIFRSGPYFMGGRGMYLNKWTIDFILENDIPSIIPIWVRMPFLPLHCWNVETIRNIGNTLRKYIDRVEPQEGLQSCVILCIEVDLEKGLPEEIQLNLDRWYYIQQVDYKQIPFKYKTYHEYVHFAKSCPQSKDTEDQDSKQDQGK